MLAQVSLRLLNEHSIMTQNVSASFKAESLQPQWLKMGLYKHVVSQELLIKKVSQSCCAHFP